MKTLKQQVEDLAKEIYAVMACEDPRGKPNWVEGGNSTKQDECRSIARKHLQERDSIARAEEKSELYRKCDLNAWVYDDTHEDMVVYLEDIKILTS